MKKTSESKYPITSLIKESIGKLPSEIQSKFLRLLEVEKDKQNFNAIVSEVKFGAVLTQIGATIDHENKIESLTPDWTLTVNQQNISLFEVYRLGKSARDSQIDNIYNLIDTSITALPYNLYVEISVNDNILNTSIEEIHAQIPNACKWLESNQSNLYASKNFEDLFGLTIKKIDTGKHHILCSHGFRLIDQKPHKLVQNEGLKDNEITKKLKKYANIISKYNMPYFLCVEIDFVSGFHYSDFKEYFFYQSAEFPNYDSDYLYLPEMGKQWSVLGEFYNTETRKNLSGLLIIDNNKIKTLINPCKDQTIHSEQYKDLLLKIQVLDNTQLYESSIPANVLKMIETMNEDLKEQFRK